MRASDLVEMSVVDTNGRGWGQVHDLHLVQDGPRIGEGDAAFRLHGLRAGRGSFATRLGYSGRANKARGPWIIKALVRALDRRSVYIPWPDVVAVERDRIVIEPPQV